jgi:hypothetical protein
MLTHVNALLDQYKLNGLLTVIGGIKDKQFPDAVLNGYLEVVQQKFKKVQLVATQDIQGLLVAINGGKKDNFKVDNRCVFDFVFFLIIFFSYYNLTNLG